MDRVLPGAPVAHPSSGRDWGWEPSQNWRGAEQRPGEERKVGAAFGKSTGEIYCSTGRRQREGNQTSQVESWSVKPTRTFTPGVG